MATKIAIIITDQVSKQNRAVFLQRLQRTARRRRKTVTGFARKLRRPPEPMAASPDV